ncbi:MAG TPA: DUF6527 family protein [Drouetiella sp.]
MDKLRKPSESYLQYCGEGHEQYIFFCPGCEHDHTYIVKWGAQKDNWSQRKGKSIPIWSFNGSMDKPTFEPSLLYTPEEHGTKERCHLFLRNGVIEFLSDCSHKFAGQKVPL